MVFEDGVFVRFEHGDKAMIIACPDKSLRRYWSNALNEYIGKQVTIKDTFQDSYGYYYRFYEVPKIYADHRFLIPIDSFEISSESENESELSQPQICEFLSAFKVV